MQHSVPHDLDRPLAKRAVEAAIAHYRGALGKYAPQAAWRDEWSVEVSFHAAGMTLAGVVEIGPRAVDLDLDVPFVLRPLRSRATAIIEREAARWVAKAKAGEV